MSESFAAGAAGADREALAILAHQWLEICLEAVLAPIEEAQGENAAVRSLVIEGVAEKWIGRRTLVAADEQVPQEEFQDA